MAVKWKKSETIAGLILLLEKIMEKEGNVKVVDTSGRPFCFKGFFCDGGTWRYRHSPDDPVVIGGKK